jgi:hypothetical protein
MASIKHIDKNPEFVFEYTPDVEHVVKDMLSEHYLTELLDGSYDYLPSGKKKLTIQVDDTQRADILSKALRMFRINFYGLKKINSN